MKRLQKIVSSFSRRELLALCLLVIATLVVYLRMWGQDFINLDDNVYVTENIHVQGGLTLKGVIWALTDIHQVTFWLPATWISLMVDHDLYGLHAGGYKLTNLLLHLANVLILLMLFRKMTGRFWPSAFVAALFALHPTHVESVAWVTERKDVLSTLFWLIAMWAYLGYVSNPGKIRYLLTLFAFVLGLMAKPMVVTLPFALLLLDFWPLKRLGFAAETSAANPKQDCPRESVTTWSRKWKVIAEKIPFLVPALAVSYVSIIAVQQGQKLVEIDAVPFGVRCANALVSYIAYIGITLWPLDLGVMYPHPGATIPWWKISGSALILLLISLAALKEYRRRPYLLTGWLWYLGTLFPVMGFLQNGPQAMADRFIYVPSIGLYLILAWGIPDLVARVPQRQRILSISAAAVLVAAAALSWTQVGYWQDNFTLYEHTLGVTKDNITIHTNLGVAFLDRGEPQEAAKHFAAAIRLNPDSGLDHSNLGFAYAEMGRLDDAVKHCLTALKLDPRFAGAHNNLGYALALQGKDSDAIEHFSEALRLKPNYPTAHTNMGNAWNRLGRIAEAALHFSQATTQDPDYAEAHFNLGSILLQQGDFPSAAHEFAEVARIDPNNPEAFNNLGIALAQQGKLREAENSFSQALRLDPTSEKIKRNIEQLRR